MRGRLVSVFMVCLVVTISSAYAHPADGYSPVYLPPADVHVTTSPLTGTYGDLTFGSCQLTVSDLSPAELYILHGASGSSYGTGNCLCEWYHDIFMISNAIRSQTGSLPEQLNVEVISLATGPDPNTNKFDHLKSPITNEFPRLDAVTFSPGQVYMRVLTESEMYEFASMVPEYQQIWFDGEVIDPDTCEVIEYVKLISPVYYMRVYGEQGILIETFQYLMAPR